MWTPETSTHVSRGRGGVKICELCHLHIHTGERYDRSIYRIGRIHHERRLMIVFRHSGERDCPYAEFDLVEQELLQEARAEIGVAITMVVSSRLVAKVALNGETIYVPESYLEMKAEHTAESHDDADDYGLSDDGDDEIPF